MENKTITTIDRQFGSGGRGIGKETADQPGIPFCDKELTETTAREGGMGKGLFEKDDARTSEGFQLLGVLGYSLGGSLPTIAELSLNDHLYLVQEEVIKGTTCEGSCVIAGRCADYMLRDCSDVSNMYIYTDMEGHKERAVHSYEVGERDIEGNIKKIDKHRANYYKYYTDRKWGHVESHDISINSSTFDIDDTMEIIKMLTQEKAL